MKEEHKELHDRLAEDWVRRHLTGKYSVQPHRLSLSDNLKDWGLGDEKSLADLAGDFNQETGRQPNWHGADIPPPRLIAETQGKSVGDLVSCLASHTAENALPASARHTVGEIQAWLVAYFEAQLGVPVSPGAKLGAYPDIPYNINSDAWTLERRYTPEFGPCDGIFEAATGLTLSQLALKLYRYLPTFEKA